MKKTTAFILCALLIFSLWGCSSQKAAEPTQGKSVDRLNTDTNGLTPVAGDFDEALLAYIDGCTQGNYMISPLSFRYALGLLVSGAAGETEAQLLSALGVETKEEWTAYCNRFNGFVQAFYEGLAQDTQAHKQWVAQGMADENSQAPFRALRVANSIWKRDDITADFDDAYAQYISQNYDAEYNTFNRSNAVERINQWVSSKTEKMIAELLPQGYNTENLAVVLMNALYYKNTWVNAFDEYLTADGAFTTAAGDAVTKTFMEQTENMLYYDDGTTQIAVLPMEGGVNMALVLGDSNGIAAKLAAADYRQVHVKVPKIDLETSLDGGQLTGFLKEKGVTDAFDSQKADFSAMIDYRVWVDDIMQKTRIKTDETGMEAAAVTAIMMNDCAMPVEPPAEFIADRPFSFFIYADCEDITPILFAGKILN